MVQIEEYADKYHDQVLQLILDIQNKEFNIAITSDQQPDLSNIRDYYQQGLGNFWVALKDQRVVGSISLLDISNKQVALRKMFVHTKYRGKTYQTAFFLLKKAIEWSGDHKVTEIYLGTTSKFEAAHKFYEKNNFEEIGKTELPSRFPVMVVDTKFYRYVM
jgi:N-acetylglutamate synthase-like GNAT family acetyltransferase